MTVTLLVPIGPRLSRVRREDGWVAIAAFDLDYFERVNDEWATTSATAS